MPPTSDSTSLIEDIDCRQNDVLTKLDALNDQIERLLNEYRPPASEGDSVDSHTSESAATEPQLSLVDPDAPISQLPAAA